MTERQLEIRAGLFLVAGVAAAVVAWMALGRGLPGGSITYSVDFAFAGGIPVGAAVKLAGVSVGKVRKVELRPEARDPAGDPMPVRVVLDVVPEVARTLHADVIFTVATPGPLGEASVEVEPGNTAAPALEPGAIVRGVDPPRVERLVGRLFTVLEQSARLLGEDKEALARLVRAAGGVAETIDGVLRERRNEVAQGVHDMALAAGELRTLLAESNALMRGKGGQLVADGAATMGAMREELPALLQQAKSAAAAVERMGKGLDDQNWASVREAVTRLEKASQAMERITTTADLMLKRIEKGEGTIGGVYKDPKVYQDLRDLLDDLRKHPWKILRKD